MATLRIRPHDVGLLRALAAAAALGVVCAVVVWLLLLPSRHFVPARARAS